METLEPQRGTATGESEPDRARAAARGRGGLRGDRGRRAPRRDHHGLGERQADDAAGGRGAAASAASASRCACCRLTAIPQAVADYAGNAHMRGLRVIIAGAGMSAALPGVVAANTDLPVIGVPIKAKNTRRRRARRAALGRPDAARRAGRVRRDQRRDATRPCWRRESSAASRSAVIARYTRPEMARDLVGASASSRPGSRSSSPSARCSPSAA